MFSNDVFKAFLLLFIPYVAIITAGFFVYLAIEYKHGLDVIKKNEHLQVDLAKKSIIRDLKTIRPDMEILANEDYIKQYIKSPSQASKYSIEHSFETFSRSKRIYKQIRFIDMSGMEIVRIDYNNNQASIVQKDALQNKKHRNYFKQGINLSSGSLYISPMELNIENHKIQLPHTPTIRFIMPVYNDKTIKGLIVLNYDADYLLENFDDMLTGTFGHIALLNQDGYWLRSHKKKREWGFILNQNTRFTQNHPTEWQTISTQHNGQILTKSGLFTFVSVYPLQLLQAETNGHVTTDIDPVNQQANPYIWKIISDVPSRTFSKQLIDKLLGFNGLLLITFFAIGFFTSLYFSLNLTERRKLREQMELHAKIYETSTDGIVITNSEQVIVDINAAFEEISGYTRDEIIGNRPNMFSSGSHKSSFYKKLWTDLNAEGFWEGEIHNRHKNGTIYTEWIRITAIKNSANKTTNYISLVSDITQKKSTEDELLKNAHHDPLTGAFNRLAFDERFSHDLSLAKRNNNKLALLYLDLDKFKPINDTYGHQTGDVILQNVTSRILNNIRSSDTLARVGGDEFIIILPQIENKADLKDIIDNLNQVICSPNIFDGREIYVGVSIGYALFPEDGENESELIQKADNDMFNNKRKPESL